MDFKLYNKVTSILFFTIIVLLSSDLYAQDSSTYSNIIDPDSEKLNLEQVCGKAKDDLDYVKININYLLTAKKNKKLTSDNPYYRDFFNIYVEWSNKYLNNPCYTFRPQTINRLCPETSTEHKKFKTEQILSKTFTNINSHLISEFTHAQKKGEDYYKQIINNTTILVSEYCNN